MDPLFLSDQQLMQEYKSVRERIENNGCYSARDVIRLGNLECELSKRHLRYKLTVVYDIEGVVNNDILG